MHLQGRDMYEFGPFRLDPVARTLMAQGQAVALTPKCFELLFVLVRNAGRLVDKEELMRQVWPDSFVEENNLTVNISALRKVLGAEASDQRYIQTVPRRGYCFAGNVRQSRASASPANQATAASEADAELLVGREPELQKLDGFLRHAVDGAGHMVFITGEPGIGKTALSNAFLRRVLATFPNITFCRGRCVEQYGVRESYLPILDSLSELLSGPKRDFVAGVLRSCAPTWCLQFPAVFSSTDVLNHLYRDTVGATKERMVREIVDAFAALAAAGPVILHLEDIHWADPSTVDVLRRLSHDIRKQAMLVTGTFRPEDVERANRPLNDFLLEMQAHGECEEMALGLLFPAHLAAYLDARFAPNRFGPELAALIHQNTEGQPLFAASLVQFFVERGDITRVSEHWMLTRPVSELGVETPANVGKMIRKKIDALQPEDRRTLEYASIQGEEFNSAVLARLLDSDDLALEERLDRLDKLHRLIQTTGEDELPDGTLATRYRFRHVLYQNALYSELLTKRRILLHRQTGDLMVRFHHNQGARIATQLAIHFERGWDFEHAVEFLIHAGDNARQILASDEAAKYYSRAAGLVPRLSSEQQQSRLDSIYEKRGAVYLAAGQFDRAIEDFKNLLQQARATGDLAREHFALNALAEAFFYAHRLDDLDDCAGEALRIAQHLGDENLRIATTVFIAMRQDIVGELAAAKRNFEEIIRVARALDNKSALLGALAWRGQLYFFQSEYECACQVLGEALQLGAGLRHAALLLQSRFFLGLSLGNLGRISEALAMLKEVSTMARRN